MSTFFVQIIYREPTYEAWTKRGAHPYCWTCDVDAVSPEAAADEALHKFHRMAQLSNVCWGRKVVDVFVGGATKPYL
jgi:hypothetical protein